MIQPINKIETDPRFPSGEWSGFFIQQEFGLGRQRMSLELEFKNGTVRGSGSDVIGEFRMRGQYHTKTGEVNLLKQYLGQHSVFYRGYAHSGNKGIWGVWSIEYWGTGGFHIWPRGTGDPTRLSAKREMDVPQAVLVTNGFDEPF